MVFLFGMYIGGQMRLGEREMAKYTLGSSNLTFFLMKKVTKKSRLYIKLKHF